MHIMYQEEGLALKQAKSKRLKVMSEITRLENQIKATELELQQQRGALRALDELIVDMEANKEEDAG